MSETEKKGFKLKGFIKRGEKVLAKEAPLELKSIAAQQEEFLDAKPSVLTTAVKQMFGKPKASIEKSVAPIIPTVTIEKKLETKAIEREEKKQQPVKLENVLEEDYNEALQKLSDLILEEEKGDHYVNEIPKAYVPDTRRGFSDFIKGEYDTFMLKPVSEQEPIEPGDKYPYQKFIREYIRQSSPYRGILVYHGLGSGKTCSAIAASEALFSTSNKKIIVMTPRSLRKNFLNEISFCGFRHYKLQNYWVQLDKTIPIHVAFAKSVLNISDAHLKKANHIWVPDFEQEPNYNSLSPDEQTEIRKQILSILIYDEKTNPTGRIHFISYNGIDSTKLKKIACDNPTYFDNAVIIVDEIHNLIRLMTGKIEPYLSTVTNKVGDKIKRRIVQETIGADKWKPSLCLSPRNYRRGYLFYRLFLSARNSKIIGLSGTPLINFPEELGILANVLHGYIPIVEGIVAVSGDEIEKRIRAMLLEFLYTDFVRVEPDSAGSGIRFIVSLLPEGIRKISNDIGVERIPEGSTIPSLQEILAELKSIFSQKGFRFSLEPQLVAKPLLPIYNDDFINKFIDASGKVTNSIVLMKRLTGIISYYKGSRQDLMPKVIRDVVVRVPMSEYQQNKYIIERAAEIDKDKKSKSKGKSSNPILTEVFQMNESTTSNSYRMASRQICNFAFPPQVVRPRPNNKEELELESPADEDIVDSAPDMNENTELFPEIEDDAEELSRKEIQEQEDALEEAQEEDVDAEQEGGDNSDDEADAEQEGGDNSDDEGEEEEDPLTKMYKKYFKMRVKRILNERLPQDATIEEKKALKKSIKKEVRLKIVEELQTIEPTLDYYKEQYDKEKRTFLLKQQPVIAVKPRVKTAKEALALTAKPLTLSDCKIGRKQGELYKDAIDRVKKCLIEFASDNLRADRPEGLSVLTAKYVAILNNIQNAPGSSLVYSQFLDMEGIGIFRMAMDINGYAPIEILSTDKGNYQFSERTIASFKKGTLQSRYITFSGQEKEDVRKLGLDIFNARFNELPESLLSVLLEAGFKENDNKRGQICRVFCITSAGAEGISLKNVRAVHIMEPYWNYVRLKQVKGRAIRIGSHLDLPPKERNVSIYTYVSVFSKESQVAKSGAMKIDETISMKDGISREEAIEYGIPIDDGVPEYTLTSDEHLYVVSEIKRKIIEQLENTMKSAAVDCEINYAENKDGTFKCYPLKGNVGDFLYHADI